MGSKCRHWSYPREPGSFERRMDELVSAATISEKQRTRIMAWRKRLQSLPEDMRKKGKMSGKRFAWLRNVFLRKCVKCLGYATFAQLIQGDAADLRKALRYTY